MEEQGGLDESFVRSADALFQLPKTAFVKYRRTLRPVTLLRLIAPEVSGQYNPEAALAEVMRMAARSRRGGSPRRRPDRQPGEPPRGWDRRPVAAPPRGIVARAVAGRIVTRGRRGAVLWAGASSGGARTATGPRRDCRTPQVAAHDGFDDETPDASSDDEPAPAPAPETSATSPKSASTKSPSKRSAKSDAAPPGVADAPDDGKGFATQLRRRTSARPLKRRPTSKGKSPGKGAPATPEKDASPAKAPRPKKKLDPKVRRPGRSTRLVPWRCVAWRVPVETFGPDREEALAGWSGPAVSFRGAETPRARDADGPRAVENATSGRGGATRMV